MHLKILYAAFFLVAVGCERSHTPQTSEETKLTVRTDLAPISKQLPKLGQLQSVWWVSTRTTIDSPLSPPGQPSYRIRGLAQLEREKADGIARQFEWQDTSPNWKPALAVTNFNLGPAVWVRSDAFTKAFKPQQTPGELFFERNKGVVYFDLEVE